MGGVGGGAGGWREVLGFLKGPLFRRSCTRNALQQGQIVYNLGLLDQEKMAQVPWFLQG